MKDEFRLFDDYKMEKRSKISTMDTIIRNNEEFKENEIDVLFRGYIVLIYAFWEGVYKKIGDLFYEFFAVREIQELPHGLKNSVIIELSTDNKEKQSKIGDLVDYRKIVHINEKITDLINKKICECENYDKVKTHFKEQTNNPNYDKLEKFLKKYGISLRKIVEELIEERTIPEDFKKRLDFVVRSRNNIAHGNENLGNHDNYKDYICENFFEGNDISTSEISEFLRETTFYIDTLYRSIVEVFKNKYMHDK